MSPRAGLDRCGKSRPPTGIRSPDRPARSQSLYRLRYPAHSYQGGSTKIQYNTFQYVRKCLENVRLVMKLDVVLHST